MYVWDLVETRQMLGSEYYSTWNLFCLDPSPSRVSLTWEVAAASGRAAPHPAALIHGHRPGLKLVGVQGIGCEVADLQLCEMVDEIVI